MAFVGLCKIINKGRQYNLLKPPRKLNSSGGENTDSHSCYGAKLLCGVKKRNQLIQEGVAGV